MAKNCRRQTEVCVRGEEARDHHNYICAKLVGTAYKVRALSNQDARSRCTRSGASQRGFSNQFSWFWH
eukprot:scaffold6416_cov111-Skeletonema_marinoi.AAC.4